MGLRSGTISHPPAAGRRRQERSIRMSGERNLYYIDVRYSLLPRLACPSCRDALVCFTAEERPATMPAGLFPDATRVSPGPGLGSAAGMAGSDAAHRAPQSSRRTPAGPERGREVEVESGCSSADTAAAGFRIERGIPELLPGPPARRRSRSVALREDAGGGAGGLRAGSGAVPPSRRCARRSRRALQEGGDRDQGQDRRSRVLRARLQLAVQPVELRVHDSISSRSSAPCCRCSSRSGVKRVIDSGCGYAWTTEWLFRSRERRRSASTSAAPISRLPSSASAPSGRTLVVGDVENLPFKTHRRCGARLRELPSHSGPPARDGRLLPRAERAGALILAEPGGAHEHAEVSVDAMEKYGILERGMELATSPATRRGSRSIPGTDSRFPHQRERARRPARPVVREKPFDVRRQSLPVDEGDAHARAMATRRSQPVPRSGAR